MFMDEAVKYNVLPIDDRSIERFDPVIAGRPDLMNGRTKLTLYKGAKGIPETVRCRTGSGGQSDLRPPCIVLRNDERQDLDAGDAEGSRRHQGRGRDVSGGNIQFPGGITGTVNTGTPGQVHPTARRRRSRSASVRTPAMPTPMRSGGAGSRSRMAASRAAATRANPVSTVPCVVFSVVFNEVSGCLGATLRS